MSESNRKPKRDAAATTHRRAQPPRGNPAPLVAPHLPDLDPQHAEHAARALWIAMAALVGARAVLAFVPGMWAWSLNLQRFADPVAGWGLWALSALALLPALARRIEPLCSRIGDAATDRPGLAFVAWALAAAALVWSMPDRLHYVGDFLLRQRTLEVPAAQIARWYPQALGLDLFVHDTVGRVAIAALGIDAGTFGRVLGAIEAAVLGVIAVAFARTMRLRGTAGFAVTAILLFGGALSLFTGYNKAFSEMCLVTGALGLAMARMARERRGLALLSAALAIAALSHRSILMLLPAAALAVLLAWRDPERGSWRRPGTMIALALPLVVLAISTRSMVSAVQSTDARHFMSDEVRHLGVVGAALAPSRISDLINLVLLMSPLFVPVAAIMIWRSSWTARRRDVLGMAALAVSLTLAALVIHPGQGWFRDWDLFAPAGIALALVAAWGVGEVLRVAARFRWMGVTAVIAVLVPALQWMMIQSDLDRGLTRARALVTEPPVRESWPTTSTWEFLGLRHAEAERWEESARAYRVAARRLPSPNILRQLADAETQAGHIDSARVVYRLMSARDPGDGLAWLGLGVAAFKLGDYDEARRATLEVLRIDPGNAEARAALDYMDRRAAADPAVAGDRKAGLPASP